MSRAQTFGKNNFSEPEKLFFNLQLEGSPFAVALWAAGKGTWKASCLLPRVSGRENEKTTFRGLKSCFFNLQFGRVSLCSGALGSWKRHLKSFVPAPKSVWKGKWKNNFSGPEKLFFLICNLEGSPFCSGALGSWKSNMSLALFSKLISRSFPLIANSWNTPREWPR